MGKQKQSGHVPNRTVRKTLSPAAQIDTLPISGNPGCCALVQCIEEFQSELRGSLGADSALSLNVKELTSPGWIKAKGFLFLILAFVSAVLLFMERPTLRVAALLVLVAWSFCRFYYFAFYVLERYVDPAYRFSGLFSLARYLLGSPRHKS